MVKEPRYQTPLIYGNVKFGRGQNTSKLLLSNGLGNKPPLRTPNLHFYEFEVGTIRTE